MTTIEEIRNIIDDHIQVGVTTELSNGGLQVYQLNTRNFWNLSVADDEGNDIDVSTLTQYPMSGQIKGTLPEGEITFTYDQAGFTDAEITTYYAACGNSIKKTALQLVEILLASAAKRFDYKSGQKDIKASQVFEHLKELRLQLQETIIADDGGLQGGIFVDREHPAYAPAPEVAWPDVSRSDS